MKKTSVLDHNPRIVRRPWERTRVSFTCEGESKTQQSHRDSVDVNAIVARFDRTGQLPPGRIDPQYGDVSDMNRPYAELIEQSRDVLDRAGQFVEESDAKMKVEARAKADQEAAELAELRALKAKMADDPPK